MDVYGFLGEIGGLASWPTLPRVRKRKGSAEWHYFVNLLAFNLITNFGDHGKRVFDGRATLQSARPLTVFSGEPQVQLNVELPRGYGVGVVVR